MNDVTAPGYWMNETSGVLRPVIEDYLRGCILTGSQIRIMRAYLRQWIAAPAWIGPGVEDLRHSVDGLTTTQAIREWIDCADDIGIDPL